MSFATNLYTLMIGDISINAEIDGGIYYENLPDNFDIKRKWILYFFSRGEQIDCMGYKNAYTVYEVTAIIFTQTTTQLDNLTTLLIEYLNGNTTGSIQDINFQSDGHSYDPEKKLYTNTLTFKAIFG